MSLNCTRGTFLLAIATLALVLDGVSFPVPTNVRASRGRPEGVAVEWGSVDPAAYYKVFDNTTGLSGWIDTNGFLHAAASRGAVYRYRVKSATAANGSGESSYSANTTAAIGFVGYPLSEYVFTNGVVLEIATSGGSGWVGQYAADGVSRQLVSGLITQSGERTILDFMLTGQGTLGFDWKVDSNVYYNGLFVYLKGALDFESPVFVNPNWTSYTKEINVASEEETTAVRIVYEKFGAGSGLDCAWVQNLTWTPSASERLPVPQWVAASDAALIESVSISWEAVPGATHYRVWRAAASNGADRVMISAGWQSGDSLTDNSAVVWGGEVFWYFVEAAASAAGAQASLLSQPDQGSALLRAANDFLGNASVLLPAVGGVVTGTCAGATSHATEPVHAGVASATNSVWWQWTPTTNRYARFAVQGTETPLPLVIAVYTNAGSVLGLTTLVEVGSGVTEADGWAAAELPGVAGTVYYIAVAGENGAAGALMLAWEAVWSKTAPGLIRASQGSCFEKVLVEWEPVADATHYEVWRQLSPLRPDRLKLGNWQSGCSFEDTTAAIGVTYYYSVRGTLDALELLAGSFSAAVAGYAGSRPENDNLISATAVVGERGTVEGDCFWATHEAGEPQHGGFAEASNSVWWCWTAPETAVYVFTTDGSDTEMNEVLAVYAHGEEGMGGLVPVAAAERGSGVCAQIVFEAAVGMRYWIAVAGRQGGGAVRLNWEPTEWLLPAPANVQASDGTVLWLTRVIWQAVPGASRYEVSRAETPDDAKIDLTGWTSELSFDDWSGDLGVTYYYYVRASDVTGTRVSGYSLADAGIAGERPWNDHLADAESVEGVAGTVTATSALATREAGEPQHGGFSDAGASIWYRWVAPVSAPAVFSSQTGISFNAVLAVYTNTASGGLKPVAYAERGTNDAVHVTFDVAAGCEYLVAVAGRPNAGGAVTLSWSYGAWGFPAPSNVTATAGTLLGRSLVSWDSVTEASAYEVSRAETAGGPRTVVCPWFEGLSWEDANDGQGRFYFVRAAYNSEGVLAGEYGGPAEGWGAVRPANDDRSAASVFSNDVFRVYGDSAWATAETDEPSHGGTGSATNSVWWGWTAPQEGVASFNATASVLALPVVAVYTNAPDGLPVAVDVTYSNGCAEVWFNSMSGVTYLIAVAGEQGAGGLITLERSFEAATSVEPPPPPLILGLSPVKINGQDFLRLRFEAKRMVTYEVFTTPALSQAMVWESLSPSVTGCLQEADGILELDVPKQGATAFFKLRAISWEDSGGGPDDPPAPPLVTEITMLQVGLEKTLRIKFTCEAGVRYNVKRSVTLAGGGVWQDLAPEVWAVAETDGFLELDVLVDNGMPQAFFKIEASR